MTTVENAPPNLEDAVKPVQGRVTGVIVPPPEIRAVADKTAQFVARNGKSFEQKILGSADGKTPKFNFMRVMDPYHAYYEMKIKEFEEGTSTAPKPVQAAPEPNKSDQQKQALPKSSSVAKASIQNPLSRFAMNKPKEAPRPFQFVINHPAGISNSDIDIIKLTARYTAINGREFLSGLAQREQRNPQFDFLKPTHMLFTYFTTFVDAYAKILAPPPDLLEDVRRRVDRLAVLESAVQRWEWNRMEEERKKKELSDADAEKNALQAIDWYDFVVVETIDFGENELLEMANFAAMNPYADRIQNVNVDTTNMDVIPPPPPPPVEDMDMDMDDIKIVSDYKPRVAGGKAKLATMIDPISGKAVPVSDLGEHMRIQLMDPKWRTEQQRFLSKQQETGYAEGSSIADSLKSFARQREDIFSTADEDEAAFAEEQRKKQKRTEETNQVIWDGHQSSLAAVQQQKSALAAIQPPAPAPPSGVSIGPSFTAYSAPVVPPPPPVAPLMFVPPPPPQPVMPPPLMPYPGLPVAPPGYLGMPLPPPAVAPLVVTPALPVISVDQKSVLLPETEFAARYPNGITLHVNVAAGEASGSSFVSLSLSVTSQVKDLKELLVEKTGVAANKQQIKYSGVFLKDPQTFASLNIGDNAQLELIGRSRGGKR